MTLNEIKRVLKLVLIALSVYIVISLITGAALVSRNIAPFGVGFVLTAVWAGVMAWLIELARE